MSRVLTDFYGTPIAQAGPNDKMTIKDVFLTHLGLWNPRDGAKHIRAYALGVKLLGAGEEALLEDAEAGLLKEAMAEPKTAVMVYVPAKEALDSAKKETIQ